MEEATPLSGAATCKNEELADKTALSKSRNAWNNNNNILTGFVVPEEPGGRKFVTGKSKSYDILNGNDAAVVVSEYCDNQTSSNTDSPVPVGCSAQTNSEFTTIECTGGVPINNNTRVEIPGAPFSQQELIQSAVELIDSSGPHHLVRSPTCPKPVFVDPNKPDKDLRSAAGALDMAATSSTLGTKKTVLTNVRLVPASKSSSSKSSSSSSPLPNGTINNKTKVPPSILKVKSVPNDETPLMGNSQRTDTSSVCVKQPGYGTHVPSNRNDHLHSSSSFNNVPDSDHTEQPSHQRDRGGKHACMSSGESGDGIAGPSSKPATLGEQFEASKAQEGKKKKSKKKKKKVAHEQDKMTPSSPVAVSNDNTEETFELALQDLPPPTPKNTLVSSDSVTSNEEFSSDTGGATVASPVKPTIASKILDGSFQKNQEQKASRPRLDSTTKSEESTVIATDCKVQGGNEQIKSDKVGDTVTTHSKSNKMKPTETNTQYKTDFKTILKTDGENDKIRVNDKQMESNLLLNMTSHPNTHVLRGQSVDMEDFPYPEETSPGDDDGEFQEVLSSRRSRRARKIKGVSMDDRSYTYKPMDKDGVRRGNGNNTSGLRKSSSEPGSMARLGELESDHHFDNFYGRKLSNNRNNIATLGKDATNNDKPALTPPPKPNAESTPPSVPASISYAGKVKAGIVHHGVSPAQNAPKSMNPVKFTLEDEHSDGHVSDSSIKSPQNDGPSPPNQSQRTIVTNLHPPTVQTKGEELSADANKITEDGKPKQDMSVQQQQQQRAGGTSPKFEISFGEFTPVYISGAPRSLKTSCDIATSEGLTLSTSPRRLLQKTRSNSVDGLETTEGMSNNSDNTTSTTLQHQEANVQYLDLHQQSANTYASRLKRSLPPSSPSKGLTPPGAGEDPVKATVRQNEQIAMETSSVPEPPVNSVFEQQVDKQKLATSDHLVQGGIGIKVNQANPPDALPLVQSGSHTVPKPQSSTLPRFENKNRQVAKASHIAEMNMAIVSSPTPSITSSRGASSVCFPLSMEPIDLGITFGDVNITEVLNEMPVINVARRDSPVDKLLASGAADESSLPRAPSSGHSCTDLETAWRGENKVAAVSISPAHHLGGGGDKMKGGAGFVLGIKRMNPGGRVMATAEMESANIGNFNYYEVAGMLMKAWASTLEQKEANPSHVRYFTTTADPSK